MITIVDWRPLNSGCLRGFISLELPGGFTIHGFKLFEKNGNRWINLPERQYTKTGPPKYSPVVEIPDRRIAHQFEQDVLQALDLYLKEANGDA